MWRALAVLVMLGGCRPAPLSQVTAVPVRVSPEALDFGLTWVGFPTRREVSLTNPNQAPLAVELSTVEPFWVVSAPAEVAAGSDALAVVEFRPAEAGVATALLTVNQLTLSMSGQGARPFDCAAPAACATSAFSPDAGTCLSSPRPDGTDCSASNSCFAQARCQAGVCVGVLTTCDDGNACTTDVCGSGGCAHLDGLPHCPVPSDPCQVATCEGDAGCGVGLASDGTACGASNCTVALVCIGGACVQRPPPVGQPCVDQVCQAAQASCGAVAFDGGTVRCGTCGTGQICDATTHQCTAIAVSCADAGLACGSTLDACGFDVVCPNTCPGACLGNTCTPHCTPINCNQRGFECGAAGDGCGSLLCCGNCAALQTCEGDGLCHLSPASNTDAGCVPRTCAQLSWNCGTTPDGCGGTLWCGTCAAPEVCGGAGTAHVCAVPREASCGRIWGEWGLVDCGGCPSGESCGGGGVPYRCGTGSTCTPLSCAQQGIGCGPAGDGCGGVISCGFCSSVSTCNVPVYRSCGRAVPLACRQLGLDCGVIQSACGPSVDCGSCSAPQTCQSHRCAP